MTPAQDRRASRLARLVGRLRDEAQEAGDEAACSHLSASIRSIEDARGGIDTSGNTPNWPLSVSLPIAVLGRIRELASHHADGQTGVMVDALRRWAVDPPSRTAPSEETERNDARVSLRVPADLMASMDARASAMGATRSRAVRMAFASLGEDAGTR